MKHSIPIILTALTLSGCQAIEQLSDVASQARCKEIVPKIDAFFEDHPDTSDQFKSAIMESRVMQGMTKDMVVASWGSKADKITLTGATRWSWENRQPQGEWVDFSKGTVVDASTFKPMYMSTYNSCTQ